MAAGTLVARPLAAGHRLLARPSHFSLALLQRRRASLSAFCWVPWRRDGPAASMVVREGGQKASGSNGAPGVYLLVLPLEDFPPGLLFHCPMDLPGCRDTTCPRLLLPPASRFQSSRPIDIFFCIALPPLLCPFPISRPIRHSPFAIPRFPLAWRLVAREPAKRVALLNSLLEGGIFCRQSRFPSCYRVRPLIFRIFVTSIPQERAQRQLPRPS